MNDFEGPLASDFGFKPQGKSAPMAGSKSTSTVGGSSTHPRFSSNSFEDRDSLFTTANPQQKSQEFGSGFGNLFSFACYAPKSDATTMTSSSFNFDMFRDSCAPEKSSSSSSAPPPPIYDKAVYDDDIFDSVLGLKSLTSNAKYEDVFTSVAASSLLKRSGSDAFDDLLGGFGNVDCSYNLSPKELCTKISLCD